jgi:hypothetical protein
MQRRPGAKQRNDAIHISEDSSKASADVEPANRRPACPNEPTAQTCEHCQQKPLKPKRSQDSRQRERRGVVTVAESQQLELVFGESHSVTREAGQLQFDETPFRLFRPY